MQLAREGEIVVHVPRGHAAQEGPAQEAEARPHTGAARIALAAGVPLVPAAIAGTDRLSRLGPLRVAYGEPIDVSDLEELDAKRAAHDRDRAPDGAGSRS